MCKREGGEQGVEVLVLVAVVRGWYVVVLFCSVLSCSVEARAQ